MIPRYSLPEMSAVWSEERRLQLWQEIEALATEAWEKEGVAPPGTGAAIRRAPPVDAAAWKAREAETGHDLAAFVDVLAGSMTTGGHWVHYGLTSSDVIDTANGVLMTEAADLLLGRVTALFEVVKRRASQHQDSVMVGRTHGVWAEPTTFGLKVATWAFELARAHRRLTQARATVAVGKLSGAVGTYGAVPPAVEGYVTSALGLGVEPASSQVTHRDRHAEYVATLALIGGTLERMATEIRHLARSEVREVREAFGRTQKGSSAMPHKRNPIGSENITGLARLLRGYAQAALESTALWHERDISHSSVERVVLPDACLVLDFALARMTSIVDRLEVDTGRMAANLTATGGLVYSQQVLLALVAAGLSRDEAYRIVQRNALAAWDGETDFRQSLAADPEVPLDDSLLTQCFDPGRSLRNTSVVWDRLERLEL